MTEPLTIPIVRVSRKGKECLVGLASDMETAERLLLQLERLYRGHGGSVYIDCARTPEEIQEETARESDH